MFGDEQGFETASAVARNFDAQGTILGQGSFGSGAIAVVAGLNRLVSARCVAQVVGEFSAQSALDQCFLECGLDPFSRTV